MLLIWCLCLIATSQAHNYPRVKTTEGWVVGRKAVDGDYLEFYGIPYAGPIGANRFKPPTPAPTHTKDFQAIDKSISCYYRFTSEKISVEDCLVLSIHTRNVTTAKPVFVWLEGVELKLYPTPTSYSYKSLVMEDLIVVSINYRRSIFGFLCLRIPEAPGNVGLKDVFQGLKWIRDNIAGFGGDPNNVMLVGHEFGAVLVDLITLSPMSENLVHKAVALSGSALSPWAVAYEPIQYAEALSARMFQGVTGSKVADILSLFNYNLLNQLIHQHLFDNSSLLFAPCIEDDNNQDGTFLSKSPMEILRSGDYNHIPYIAGYTQREGTIRMYGAENLKKMEIQFSDFLPLDLGFYSVENKIALASNIREFYFATERISMENLDKYFNYHGDVLITIPVLRAAQERAKTSKENVRLFEFAYNSTMNSDWRYETSPVTGAPHGVLPKYLFGYDLNSHDVDASNSIIDMLTGFAYYGKPFRSPNKSETWLPVTEESLNKLYISGEETADNITEYSEQVVQENGTPILFWDTIYKNYYKPPIEITTSAATYLKGITVRKPFRSPNKSETWLPVTEESLNKLYISGGETADEITEYSEQVVQENGTPILFWDTNYKHYYKPPAKEITTSAATYLKGFTVRSMIVYIFVPIFVILFF